tara:strand:+ start:6786 stop:7049 length:264 start_codon:yes stop_codon:yes gene_type:complete
MKPKHYKTKDKDVIDFCKDYDLNFNRGNIVKYVARADKKGNELEDLLKAKDYIKREIKFLKQRQRLDNYCEVIYNEGEGFTIKNLNL